MPLSSLRSDLGWPPQCCVPAFLGTAITILAETPDALQREEVRRDLAIAIGVVVGPEDANPWGLRVSRRPDDWGVGVRDIEGSLHSLESVLGCHQELTLEVIRFDIIPFRLYEDAVVELSGRGGVIGISFDYLALTGKQQLTSARTQQSARHLARLTPSAADGKKEPNIQSPEFRTDYTGDLWVFDDSGEMGDSESLVDWQFLVKACWAVGGGLWHVYAPQGT